MCRRASYEEGEVETEVEVTLHVGDVEAGSWDGLMQFGVGGLWDRVERLGWGWGSGMRIGDEDRG